LNEKKEKAHDLLISDIMSVVCRELVGIEAKKVGEQKH
jgi:hypothetical protein